MKIEEVEIEKGESAWRRPYCYDIRIYISFEDSDIEERLKATQIIHNCSREELDSLKLKIPRHATLLLKLYEEKIDPELIKSIIFNKYIAMLNMKHEKYGKLSQTVLKQFHSIEV